MGDLHNDQRWNTLGLCAPGKHSSKSRRRAAYGRIRVCGDTEDILVLYICFYGPSVQEHEQRTYVDGRCYRIWLWQSSFYSFSGRQCRSRLRVCRREPDNREDHRRREQLVRHCPAFSPNPAYHRSRSRHIGRICRHRSYLAWDPDWICIHAGWWQELDDRG